MHTVKVYTLTNEVILSDCQWFKLDYILFMVCWYHAEINPRKPYLSWLNGSDGKETKIGFNKARNKRSIVTTPTHRKGSPSVAMLVFGSNFVDAHPTTERLGTLPTHYGT